MSRRGTMAKAPLAKAPLAKAPVAKPAATPAAFHGAVQEGRRKAGDGEERRAVARRPDQAPRSTVDAEFHQRDRNIHPPAHTPVYKTSVLRSPRIPLWSLQN